MQGLKGFLCLLHYAGRCPTQTMNILKLTVESITEDQAALIRRYFDNLQSRNHGLRGVSELRVKLINGRRATLH